jgi:hypothetical protein
MKTESFIKLSSVFLSTLPRHHRGRLRAQGHQLGPTDGHQATGLTPTV